MSQVQKAYVVDGKIFSSKKEADDYLMRPRIVEAMNAVTENNDELTQWLVDNQEDVEASFYHGTIRRVKNSERKKLEAALEYLSQMDEPKLKFLIDNTEAISESFRWPKVRRMTDEEKAIASKNSLLAMTEDEELADWIVEHKERILEAYAEGKPKREVSEKAQNALAEWRAKKAAEKAAKEAQAS
jgi:hypothetical protein